MRNGYPGYVSGATFAQAMGWTGARVASSYAACASGVTALEAARTRILAGLCDVALVVGADTTPKGFLAPNAGELSEPQVEFVHLAPAGIDVMRLTKTRVNQSFFRKLILASYDNRCALTGIDTPSLLVASHIVPWSISSSARTNPTNGICLNSLHDRAFDEGLITFDKDFSVIYSSKLPPASKSALKSFGTARMRLPTKFVPEESFLSYHRSEIFVA